VQQCGSAVRSLKPGDPVALEPGIPCRICEYCRAGRYNLCPDVQFAATPPHDGTLAKYYTIPEDFCFKLPANISLEEGALVEPLSVAVHCAKLARITFGSSVLVLGVGPIGLLCCAVARALGSSKVIAVDIVDSRLLFARNYAATATYRMESLSPEENASRIMSSTGIGEGAEIVIDATGAEACIITGIHALKRGGTFIQAGLGAAKITFPVAQLCSKEGSYRGSFRYGPGDYRIAVELLKQERINVKELITHRYDFSEAEKAFENVEQRHGFKSIIYGPDTNQ
jgi:L-iditol 2-dehydrogenase